MGRDQQYKALLSESPDDDVEKELTVDDLESDDALPAAARRSRSELIYGIIIAVQTIIIIALAWALIARNAKKDYNPVFPQVLYSPAQDAVEYQPKRFAFGVGHDKTIYQGEPSPELDQAWHDLYDEFGLSRIPKDQARLLPNKTLPIPGDEDHYAVSLSVFHQLHCLNTVRKGLSPEYYTDPVAGTLAGVKLEDWPEHLSHCLDGIRQSLMCSADISLVVWQWIESQETASPRMDVIHSCRNYDKIADWAKAHKWQREFDLTVHVEDDIEIPIIHA